MKADLHIHTTYSDSSGTPQQVVDEAIKKGISCICITDHEIIDGAIEALKYGFDKDILIIPGVEATSKSGDVLGINVKKGVPNGLTTEETIKRIKDQGGIAVIPHFFAFFQDRFRGDNFYKADAMEIFNSSLSFERNNRAQKIQEKHNMAFTAGSDAHAARFVGRAYLEIPDIKTERDVIDAIIEKKGKVFGNPLNIFELSFALRGRVRYLFTKKRGR